MPTYEYRCTACAHAFEEFQSITADPIELCPQCGKSALKRGLGGGTGMIFKGSGFYQTDYKKGTSPSPAKSSSKDGGASTPPASENPSSPDKPKSKPKGKT